MDVWTHGNFWQECQCVLEAFRKTKTVYTRSTPVEREKQTYKFWHTPRIYNNNNNNNNNNNINNNNNPNIQSVGNVVIEMKQSIT